MGEMAPTLEALNQYLRQQEHDVGAGMQGGHEYLQPDVTCLSLMPSSHPARMTS